MLYGNKDLQERIGGFILIQDYSKAKKLGERAFRHAVVRGKYPYLPALEEMVEGIDRFPQINLGLAEIPLDLVAGTLTGGRQNSFAPNFMPLMAENTEFAVKWSSLYDAQVEEGIRDPVKAYEFLNHFYVEEGNKRVSVLRFVGAVTILANVIRIRPPKDESVQSRIYYEYLDFYKVTHMFEITFSAPGRYARLAELLGQNLVDPWPEELLEKLKASVTAFRDVYRSKGGEKLSITMGDALLIYVELYDLDSLLTEGTSEIEKRLARLWREFAAASSPEGIALIENRTEAARPEEKPHILKAAKLVGDTVEGTYAAGVAGAAQLAGAVAGAAAGLTGGVGAAKSTAQATQKAVRTTLGVSEGQISGPLPSMQKKYSPLHPLKAAFIYEKDPERSGWAYGHELGRSHLKETFGSLVETMRFENCVDEESIKEAFETVKSEGCDVVFITAPSLIRPALLFALDNPRIKVLGCGFNQTTQAVRFYYGKMYEAKFLLGALAASLTDDHRIGYAAGIRDEAAVSSVNAFALGAQLVDPYCRIELYWTGDYTGGGIEDVSDAQKTGCSAGGNIQNKDGSEIYKKAAPGKRGIHVFSDLDMIRLKDGERRYGLYLEEEDGSFLRLAAPIWNWGIFYEIAVRRILEGTYDDVPDRQKDRAVNYWLGLDSGIIDIILSDSLPKPSYRLVELLKKAIEDNRVSPFEGELRAQDGSLKGAAGKTLTNAEIMSMDWLAENVDGALPKR